MRKDACRRDPKRKTPTRSSREPIDLPDWRRRRRPQILRELVDQTRDLSWSHDLIDLMLDELHVSDEFDALIGPINHLSTNQYPQLVAIAVVLRHSWFPEDHARTMTRLGLPAALPTTPELPSSLHPATAVAHEPVLRPTRTSS